MMRLRHAGLVTLAVLLAVATFALPGCDGGETATDAPAEVADTSGADPMVSTDGLDAMPADGAGESAALAAVAGLFAAQRDSGAWTDADWAALETTGPVLVAYLVRADLGGQVALFEVRADGRAHNIYGYHRAFDSGSIIWTPADMSHGASAAPASAGEKAAVAAVETAMRDAFPDEPFMLAVHGYRFAYIAEGAQPFTIEVAPDGSLISAGM